MPSLDNPSKAESGILGNPNEYRFSIGPEDGTCNEVGLDGLWGGCCGLGSLLEDDPTRRRLKRDFSWEGETRGGAIGPSKEVDLAREEVDAEVEREWVEERSPLVDPEGYRPVNDAECCKLGAIGPGEDTLDVGLEGVREPGRVLKDAMRDATARAGTSVVLPHSRRFRRDCTLTGSCTLEVLHRFGIWCPSIIPSLHNTPPGS